jgi:hypothetical protein
MNSLNLAARRTQALASRRFFSKVSSIPTSSAANVDGVKVVGLPHLSVSDGLRLLGAYPVRPSQMLTKSASSSDLQLFTDELHEVGLQAKALA